MKATGIIRRMDDLGRVVIPREIRRMLRMKEGDPLELFTIKDGIVLKKCRVAGQIADSGSLLKAIQQIVQAPVLLCDRNGVVDAAGIPSSKYEGKAITGAVDAIIEERKMYFRGDDDPPVSILSKSDLTAEMIIPVIPHRNIFGALIIPETNGELHWDNASASLKLAAKYLELHLEETL
jgi:AbrB family transcriptional regulator (stage V sporulation protein T)